MRKLALLLGVLLIFSIVLVGCGGNDDPVDKTDNGDSQVVEYKDGTYFASQDSFDEKTGWKYEVTVNVEDSKIVEVSWTATHKDGGTDKKTRSEDGEYGMVEKSNAQWPWHEQAQKVEEYLVETQDPTDIEYIDNEGRTDAISGASIKVKEFFELAEEALEGAK